MKKKIIIFGIILFALFGPSFINSAGVFAAGDPPGGGDAGSGSGSGGDSGCMEAGWTLSTCYGATWRYYSWPKDASGNPVESVQIPHYASYAPGGTISGCYNKETKEAWGYWRYAMVAHADKPANGIAKNDQVGVSSIGNYDAAYRSKMLGGAMKYIGGDAGNLDYGNWDTVKAEFEKYREWLATQIDPITGDKWDWGHSYSSLGWFCAYPPGHSPGGEVQTRSNVYVGDGGGSDYQTTNWEKNGKTTMVASVQTGDVAYARFSHDARFTSAVAEGMVISRQIAFSQTRNGSVTPIIEGSNPASSYTYAPAVGTAANTAVAIVPSHTYKLTFPAGKEGSYTICETVTVHENYIYKDKAWSGGPWSSTSCASFIVSEMPVYSSCPIPGLDATINYGNTLAQSTVSNLSSGKTAKTSGTNSTPAVVWAKPGDSVQFGHTLCFGAQAVRGSGSSGGDRNIKPTANTATIRAFTTPGSGGNYLFGKTLTGSNSQTFNLTAGESKPTQVDGADSVGDYYFTYYSPSRKTGKSAGTTYKCSAPSLGFPTFVTNGYQIPDFTSTTIPAGCGSANTVPTVSDAGKIIEQDLEWANVIAYVNQHETSSGGSCSCNNNTAYANNASNDYAGAKSAGSKIGFHVRKCYSSGSCGCCGEYCTACYTQYYTTDYWYYPITSTNAAGATQKAQVKIPFNYTTTPNVSTSHTDVVYGGNDYSVGVTINVNKRPNTDVSTSDYATISKRSSYEIVVFTVAPSTSASSIAHANNKVSGNSSKTACSYYGTGAQKCVSLERKDGIYLNDEGSLSGATENIFSGSIGVPDMEVGTKICVAAGVWPSDSHNYTSGAAGSGDAALNDGSGSYWNYSEPTCRTIAKKPSIQFIGSGVYTTNSIVTSQSKKEISYNVLGKNGSGSNLLSSSVGGGSRRVFGSWSEYDAIAKNKISGLASGAAFGYDRNNGGKYSISASSSKSNYFSVGYNSDPDACTYSNQTFENSLCSSKVMGYSSINSFNNTLLDRLIARYTLPDSPATQTAGRRLDLSGTCKLDSKGVYKPYDNGKFITTSSYKCLENGAKYVKVIGNAYVQHESANSLLSYCMGKGDTTTSRTSVIDVSGTLTIDTNFVYGNLLSSGCGVDTYSSISELPQQLIFAGDINIVGRVTNVDAWLIAGKTKDKSGKKNGTGTINTCSEDGRYTGSGGAPKNTISGYDKTNATVCTKKLTINGPVFADKLILNRSAGAGVGTASIEAAEVFNLRADSYLWAYNQAQRFSQAVTTYSRELAPRY